MHAADLCPSEHTDRKSRDGRKPMGFRPCRRGKEQDCDEKDKAELPWSNDSHLKTTYLKIAGGRLLMRPAFLDREKNRGL